MVVINLFLSYRGHNLVSEGPTGCMFACRWVGKSHQLHLKPQYFAIFRIAPNEKACLIRVRQERVATFL